MNRQPDRNQLKFIRGTDRGEAVDLAARPRRFRQFVEVRLAGVEGHAERVRPRPRPTFVYRRLLTETILGSYRRSTLASGKMSSTVAMMPPRALTPAHALKWVAPGTLGLVMLVPVAIAVHSGVWGTSRGKFQRAGKAVHTRMPWRRPSVRSERRTSLRASAVRPPPVLSWRTRFPVFRVPKCYRRSIPRPY